MDAKEKMRVFAHGAHLLFQSGISTIGVKRLENDPVSDSVNQHAVPCSSAVGLSLLEKQAKTVWLELSLPNIDVRVDALWEALPDKTSVTTLGTFYGDENHWKL